ncbi:uncharacterized protein E0L32_002960 [Thyridium curvatum]|uniref:Uncharacterized protein n=1 Tax=Thyridium curvatum TaxID=1093900 RepID=A0A507BK94_9PEZI|nr:uncharacterized protein E0L32_002960 [Thyridium curvatum]TPX17859.1 hypothetical protein E0L32_002960 [Thyridium curvatum]
MLSRTIRPAARCARQTPRVQLAQNARTQTARSSKRFQSTGSSSASSASSGASPALVGAASGAAASVVVFYTWYATSGMKDVVAAGKQVKQYAEAAKQKVQEKTPNAGEAYKWVRDTAKSYAAFIPGAGRYIDQAFDDLDEVREKHGDEFDRIATEAYNELKDLSYRGGVNADTAAKAWEIISKHVDALMDLAGDASEDILNNHPQLKDKLGGSFDQLKEMGNNFGPQAKEEVDKTWKQVKDIAAGGMAAENIDKVKSLIKEKQEKLRGFADEAWQKGLDKSKPYLDKNPEIKKLVEDNADQLKKGNFMQLWGQIKESASSGDTKSLEKYIKTAVGKAKGFDLGGLEQWLKAVPGGSEILPKLQQLQEVADKRGEDAEKLVKETMKDLQEVLAKRAEQAKELAEGVKDDAKKPSK